MEEGGIIFFGQGIEIMKIALFFSKFSSSLEFGRIKEEWITIQLVLDV